MYHYLWLLRLLICFRHASINYHVYHFTNSCGDCSCIGSLDLANQVTDTASWPFFRNSNFINCEITAPKVMQQTKKLMFFIGLHKYYGYELEHKHNNNNGETLLYDNDCSIK